MSQTSPFISASIELCSQLCLQAMHSSGMRLQDSRSSAPLGSGSIGRAGDAHGEVADALQSVQHLHQRCVSPHRLEAAAAHKETVQGLAVHLGNLQANGAHQSA